MGCWCWGLQCCSPYWHAEHALAARRAAVLESSACLQKLFCFVCIFFLQLPCVFWLLSANAGKHLGDGLLYCHNFMRVGVVTKKL